jgi:hypothetical protein
MLVARINISARLKKPLDAAGGLASIHGLVATDSARM